MTTPTDRHRRTPLERAQANPRSLRSAINGKCFDCVGAGADPNPPRLIRECSSARCPLHPVRPYQTHSSAAESSEAGNEPSDDCDAA